ncbi:MAG: hypothetical protein L0Y72_01055 [Gemmataceae bacterium]|nr:hypothetical protein [Gemmataceae bacterium]MCI0737600.1 hypothetical protein [Gemmataceae bacterium]
MPILLQCRCGKKLKVRDEFAGKKVRCPACGEISVAGEAILEPEILAPAPIIRPGPPPLQPVQPVRARQEDEDDDDSEETPKKKSRGESECACFHFKSGGSQGLFILARDGICYDYFDNKKQAKNAAEDLENGEPLEDVLSKKAQAIPWDAIDKFITNLHLETLFVHYKANDDDTSTSFFFEPKEERDAALKELRRRLDDEFKYKKEVFTPLTAAVAPLITIVAVAAATGGLAWLAHWMSTWEGSARVPIWAALFYYLFTWLGTTGTVIIGGVIVILCVVWLFFRVAKPPIEVTLQRRKKKRDTEDED